MRVTHALQMIDDWRLVMALMGDGGWVMGDG